MQANLVSGSSKTAAEMWVQVSVICEKCVSSAAIWHLGRQDGGAGNEAVEVSASTLELQGSVVQGTRQAEVSASALEPQGLCSIHHSEFILPGEKELDFHIPQPVLANWKIENVQAFSALAPEVTLATQG